MAQQWKARGRRPSLFLTLVHPLLKCVEVYVWKLGFLDGRAGFIIAISTAFYIFAKHAKLWEPYRAERRP